MPNKDKARKQKSKRVQNGMHIQTKQISCNQCLKHDQKTRWNDVIFNIENLITEESIVFQFGQA